jgi:hypothetical protein
MSLLPASRRINGAPVVVEAYTNGAGRMYDYRIVSGPNDAVTKSQVEDLLVPLFFEPARFFGQPVRGLAVLPFRASPYGGRSRISHSCTAHPGEGIPFPI